MADYKVARVADVPDQDPNFGRTPEELEIRFLRNDLGCEHCIRVPPETPRLLRAVRDEDAVFVLVGAPNTGPGDGENIEDFWPD